MQNLGSGTADSTATQRSDVGVRDRIVVTRSVVARFRAGATGTTSSATPPPSAATA